MGATSSSGGDCVAERASRPLKGPSKRRFEQILQEGRRARGALCRVFVLSGTGHVGIGIARSLGAQPQRNRQRRRIRAAIREAADAWAHLDVVILGGGGLSKAKSSEIQAEIEALIGRLGPDSPPASESS